MSCTNTAEKGGTAAFPANYGDILNSLETKQRKTTPVPRTQKVYRGDPSKMFDEYLFRASSFGRMMSGVPKPLSERQRETYNAYHERYMGNGRSLTEKQEADYFSLGAKLRAGVRLSDGAKTYLEELVREQMFGRRNILETKYLEKGIQQEDDSIALYANFVGLPLTKNEERKKNAYWTGEADNVFGGVVRDFKTSWDFNTFPIAATEIKNKLYEWQLQVYMDLWDMNEAELIYCLVDTSAKQVEDEIRRLDWKYDLTDFGGSIKDKHIPFVVERVSNMIYTYDGLQTVCDESANLKAEWFDSFKPLAEEDRIKVFKTERNDKMIQWGKDMINLARDYMNKAKSHA